MTKAFTPATDLKAGMKVKTAEDKTLTIEKVSEGFYTESVLLEFVEGGWSCIGKNEEIEIIK